MTSKINQRIRLDEQGATAAEYALMASLIAAVIIIAVTTLGTHVNALFETVAPPWG